MEENVMHKPHKHVQTSPHVRESREQERLFLERARAGEDVRNEVVLAMQRPLAALARRMHWRYSQQQGNVIEVSDLVHSASVEILNCFAVALTKEEPFPYLYRLAKITMLNCLNGRGRIIKTHPKYDEVIVLSLDTPVTRHGTSLADILTQEDIPHEDITSLLSAIEDLPEKQRTVIRRYFGLAGHVPESFRQLSKALTPNSGKSHPNSAGYHYKRALLTLRQTLLSETRPHHSARAAGGIRP
jgi:DNA-directed RNA polymerase specialized sigma24 family protein